MYLFMYLYLFYAILLSIIGGRKYRIINFQIFTLGLIIITLMIGLRYDVGVDFPSYENNFNFRYMSFHHEKIYSSLVFLIKKTFDNFSILTLLMSIITNIFIYLGIKKRKLSSQYLVLTLFVYMHSSVFVFMNLMRQAVAFSIFFYCSQFIKEKKLKNFLACMIIASGFHVSAIFLIPLYWIRKINISKFFFIILVIICYTLVYLNISQFILNSITAFLPYYSYYFNRRHIFMKEVNVFSIGLLLRVILALGLVLLSKKTKSLEIEKNYYKLGILLNILSLSTYMFNRIGTYFAIFGIVAIPELIKDINNKRIKILAFIIVITILSTLMYQTMFVNPENSNLVYKSILNK